MFENDITEYAKDGRLCEPSDGTRYRMREMAEEVKRLGRPLTEEESEKYKIPRFDWKKFKRNEIAANLLLFERERTNSDTQFDSNCPPGCEDMPDDLFAAIVAEMREIASGGHVL